LCKEFGYSACAGFHNDDFESIAHGLFLFSLSDGTGMVRWHRDAAEGAMHRVALRTGYPMIWIDA
jgi:hypothetical protein